MDSARRQSIDQPGQKLQVKILDVLGIGKDQKATNWGQLRLVKGLVQGQLGENLVETLNQFFRVC